jgi:hypothetical protein
MGKLGTLGKALVFVVLLAGIAWSAWRRNLEPRLRAAPLDGPACIIVPEAPAPGFAAAIRAAARAGDEYKARELAGVPRPGLPFAYPPNLPTFSPPPCAESEP